MDPPDELPNCKFAVLNLAASWVDVIWIACPVVKDPTLGAVSQYVALQTQTKLLVP